MSLLRLSIFALIALSFANSGCCLKKLTLKPSITEVGSVSADVSLDFKECCPSKEQKAIALDVQKKVRDLYTELTSKPNVTQDDIDTFNRKQKAAADAIQNVILVCNAAVAAAKPETEKPETKKGMRPSKVQATQADVDRAWQNLARVRTKL
jgi:multidrug resistance efflux pump